MDPCDNTYRSWLLADPKAFVAGVRGFCKQAAQQRVVFMGGDDEDSGRAEKGLWDTIKPWLIGLGGGYLALKGGEWWGRYAQSRGYRQGPITGPFVAMANGFLPKRLDTRESQSAVPNNGQAYF